MTKTAKILVAALAGAIIVGGVCATGYASRGSDGKWFGNSDIQSWHWADTVNKGSDSSDENTFHTSTSEDNVFVAAEGQGLMLLTEAVPVEEYGDYGISPLSVENVFNLSVTYTPSDATFQQTNYTIKFANANSAWASGKILSEYAELQHSAGSKNATLIVKKPFGEKIIVTAVSQRDSSLTATFTVDYLKRIESVGGTLRPCSSWDIADDLEFSQNPFTFGVGTLTPDLDGGNVKLVIDLGSDLVNQLSSRGITADRYYQRAVGTEELVDGEFFSSLLGCFAEACNMSYSAFESVFLDIYPWIVDESNDWQYGIMYNRVYDGVNYGGGVSDIDNIDWKNLNVVGESLCVPASSMTPNGSHIIAG